MENRARVFQLHPRVTEVFHGDGLWVLDKPPGILSHPNPPVRQAGNAVLRVPYDFERELYRAPRQPGGGPREAHLIHRLDQETGGLLLLALGTELAALLREMFYHREISKEYRALVRGVLREPGGVWRDALRKERRRGQICVVVARGARPNSETRYRVLERFPGRDATLLALYPETGRSHQLRVQSAARGHPIAGDERYGDFAWNRLLVREIGLRRMFLHALQIGLRLPPSRRQRRFRADPGRALLEPLERLRALERGNGGRRK